MLAVEELCRIPPNKLTQWEYEKLKLYYSWGASDSIIDAYWFWAEHGRRRREPPVVDMYVIWIEAQDAILQVELSGGKFDKAFLG